MMAHACRLQLELLERLAAAVKVVALQLPIGARHRQIVETLQQQQSYRFVQQTVWHNLSRLSILMASSQLTHQH